MTGKPKDLRELGARALCRFHGVPEDTQFEGKPMWQSYLNEVDAVLVATGFLPKPPASSPKP